MSLKEQLQQKIEKLDDATLAQLAQTLEKLEAEKNRQASVARQLKFLEEFAEPMDDPEAEKKLLEAMERRPWFGNRQLDLEPDEQ